MKDPGNPFLPLYNQPGHILRRAVQHSQASFQVEASDVGITPPQFSVLFAIALKPGMEQHEVADAVHYDAATTGGVLDRLEKLGAVRRERSGRSSRGRAIHLAEEGERLLGRIWPSMERNQIRLLEPLSHEERVVLLRLLSKLLDIPNSYNIPAAPPPEGAD